MSYNRAIIRARTDTFRILISAALISPVVIITSCKSQQGPSSLQEAGEGYTQAEGLTENELTAVDLLTANCKACHAVGEHRFIDAQDYAATWENLFVEKPPLSASVWAEQILNSLSWPGDTPPTPSERYSDASRYMPLGSQRRRLHESRVGTMPAREFIMKEIKAGMRIRLENRSNPNPTANEEEPDL